MISLQLARRLKPLVVKRPLVLSGKQQGTTVARVMGGRTGGIDYTLFARLDP
jgi:hypothetical protein